MEQMGLSVKEVLGDVGVFRGRKYALYKRNRIQIRAWQASQRSWRSRDLYLYLKRHLDSQRDNQTWILGQAFTNAEIQNKAVRYEQGTNQFYES